MPGFPAIPRSFHSPCAEYFRRNNGHECEPIREVECVSAGEVIARHLGGAVDAAIDGEDPGGAGSTIRDTTVDPPVVIRRGSFLSPRYRDGSETFRIHLSGNGYNTAPSAENETAIQKEYAKYSGLPVLSSRNCRDRHRY